MKNSNGGKKHDFLFSSMKRINGIDIDSPQFFLFSCYLLSHDVQCLACFWSCCCCILSCTLRIGACIGECINIQLLIQFMYYYLPDFSQFSIYFFFWIVVDCRLSPTAFIVYALHTPNIALKMRTKRINQNCMIHKRDKWIVWQMTSILNRIGTSFNWSISHLNFELNAFFTAFGLVWHNLSPIMEICLVLNIHQFLGIRFWRNSSTIHARITVNRSTIIRCKV